jgi:hypothetical protein
MTAPRRAPLPRRSRARTRSGLPSEPHRALQQQRAYRRRRPAPGLAFRANEGRRRGARDDRANTRAGLTQSASSRPGSPPTAISSTSPGGAGLWSSGVEACEFVPRRYVRVVGRRSRFGPGACWHPQVASRRRLRQCEAMRASRPHELGGSRSSPKPATSSWWVVTAAIQRRGACTIHRQWPSPVNPTLSLIAIETSVTGRRAAAREFAAPRLSVGHGTRRADGRDRDC